MGWDHNIALMRYGEDWSYSRKIAHQTFRKEAVKKYQNVLLEKVHCMLYGILKNPEQFDQYNRTCAASSSLVCVLIIDYHNAGYLSQFH